MSLLRKLLFRLQPLVRKNRIDADLSDEIRTHLELQIEANIAAGMSPEEARTAARREFGALDPIKERYRDERGLRWLEDSLRDLRVALRSLSRSPGFTAVAMLTLGLGVALVTLQLGFIHGVMFRGLPGDTSSNRAMYVSFVNPRGFLVFPTTAQFAVLRAEQRSFSTLAAYWSDSLTLTGADSFARSYPSAALSATCLDVLGVHPILGRDLSPEDENPGAPTVVLLSHRVWLQDFAGDSSAVGRSVVLDGGGTATIIGVLPERFGFPKYQQVWTNLRLPAGSTARTGGSSEMIGRLHAGVTHQQAMAEFETLARRFDLTDGQTRDGCAVFMLPFSQKGFGSEVALLLSGMLALAVCVLALACFNIMNLVYARAARRRHEIAVRFALGASRGRVVRHAVAESVVLAAGGAAAGLLLAIWAAAALDRELSSDPSWRYWMQVAVDGRVAAAGVGVALIAGIFTGLIPALRATRQPELSVSLSEAAGGLAGWRLGRLNRALIFLQVAISAALLATSGSLVCGFRAIAGHDFGYDPESMMIASVGLPGPGYADPSRRTALAESLLERVRALPGVTHATITTGHPVGGGRRKRVVPSGDASLGANPALADSSAVAAGYFAAMGARLIEGREFDGTEAAGALSVAVVNQSLARAFWPGEGAVGKQIREHTDDEVALRPPLTVIGVVADEVTRRPREASATPAFCTPISQGMPRGFTMLVQTSGSPAPLIRELRGAMRDLDAAVPVSGIQTVAESFADQLHTPNSFVGLGITFACGALLLATVGLYGQTAFAVESRTREFGLRMALGATSRAVVTSAVQRAVLPLAIGLGVGLMLGWAGGHGLSVTLFRQTPRGEILMLVPVAASVVLPVVFSCWLAARRATRIDPMAALRAQ